MPRVWQAVCVPIQTKCAIVGTILIFFYKRGLWKHISRDPTGLWAMSRVLSNIRCHASMRFSSVQFIFFFSDIMTSFEDAIRILKSSRCKI